MVRRFIGNIIPGPADDERQPQSREQFNTATPTSFKVRTIVCLRLKTPSQPWPWWWWYLPLSWKAPVCTRRFSRKYGERKLYQGTTYTVESGFEGLEDEGEGRPLEKSRKRLGYDITYISMYNVQRIKPMRLLRYLCYNYSYSYDYGDEPRDPSRTR